MREHESTHVAGEYKYVHFPASARTLRFFFAVSSARAAPESSVQE